MARVRGCGLTSLIASKVLRPLSKWTLRLAFHYLNLRAGLADLFGDVNSAVEVILAAIEANIDPALKPPPFWTHFHSVAGAVIECITGSAASAATPAATANANSQEDPSQSRDANLPALEFLDSTLQNDSAAANGVNGATGALAPQGRRKAKYLHPAAPSAVPSAPAGSHTVSPAGSNEDTSVDNITSANGAMVSSSDNGALLPQLSTELKHDVVLHLARFWLALATRLSTALATPDGHTRPVSALVNGYSSSMHNAWRLPASAFTSDHALLRHVLAHLRQLLARNGDGFVEEVVGLQDFQVMVKDTLFHADIRVRGECTDLLVRCVLKQSSAAQLAALQVCVTPLLMRNPVAALAAHCQQLGW